jgi:transcriptional regulator of acetoin/glycerol metabolism
LSAFGIEPRRRVTTNDDSTLRLEETEESRERASVTAIVWILPSGRRRETRLDGQHFTLGRGETEDIRLDASGLSRSHAELTRQGPVYAIHDRGSTNGTFVNGRRVEHAALSRGDVVRLGDALGVVVRIDSDNTDGADATDMGEGLVFGPGLRNELTALRRVAPTNLPVVVEGETGVGKECFARTLHRLSGRAGPFHAVNCAALPSNLAETELFGHKKGAFTNAEQAGLGHFRAAHGGTLFLDELADLSLAVQAKLLRALQEGEVTALGETQSRPVDVRFVAALQAPLFELVQAKRLREDLAMRLRGLVLRIPPLRQRREDIQIHFRAFLARYSGGRAPALEPRMLEALLRYDWPGNVRELELVTRQLLALHGHEAALRRGMLPVEIRDATAEPDVVVTARSDRNREEHDLEALSSALKQNGGNLARAAAAAGVSRQRAYRLLAKQGSQERERSGASTDQGAEDDGRE